MCRKLGKRVIVICGVNTVKPAELCQVFGDITVIDFTSRFGAIASKTETTECLRKVCETEIYDLIK